MVILIIFYCVGRHGKEINSNKSLLFPGRQKYLMGYNIK